MIGRRSAVSIGARRKRRSNVPIKWCVRIQANGPDKGGLKRCKRRAPMLLHWTVPAKATALWLALSCPPTQKRCRASPASAGRSTPNARAFARNRVLQDSQIFLSNSSRSKPFISKLTFYYEMTQEHGANHFCGNLLPRAIGPGGVGPRLYRITWSRFGVQWRPRLPAPWTAVICNRARH